MKRVIAILCLLPTLSFGAPECSCRSKGVVAYEGQIICLQTPNGPQLARCEKVLNNTSWRFLQRPCDEQITDQSNTPDYPTTTASSLPPALS